AWLLVPKVPKKKHISLSGVGDALSETSGMRNEITFMLFFMRRVHVISSNGQHSLKARDRKKLELVEVESKLETDTFIPPQLWFGVSKLSNRLKHEINNGGFDRNTRLTLALDEVDLKVEAGVSLMTLRNMRLTMAGSAWAQKKALTIGIVGGDRCEPDDVEGNDPPCSVQFEGGGQLAIQ
ncbi:LOW QUALITY PROTEIN: hypothetical protein M8C21_024625, partial [Ambrosia artemisiifolia]